MSSLPQGWHGIPVAIRSDMASNAPLGVASIRKKWNSPLSAEAPRSKLPAYKSSNLRLQKSAVNGMIPTKTSLKMTSSEFKNDVASLLKPSPAKQYQGEITKLKKELATVKTENSILKVKVRRVDDENLQKTKQIEKLRLELKAVNKELLGLRQKCLRLEGVLKEKNLALNTFRKLHKAASLKDDEVSCQTFVSDSEMQDVGKNKEETFAKHSKMNGSVSSKSQTSLPRSSHSSKTEVAKLREIIHKLEKENQELQHLVKGKSEEVRQLKVHLRSQTFTIKPSQLPVSKSAPKEENASKIEKVPNKSQHTLKKVQTLKSSPGLAKSSATDPNNLKTSHLSRSREKNTVPSTITSDQDKKTSLLVKPRAVLRKPNPGSQNHANMNGKIHNALSDKQNKSSLHAQKKEKISSEVAVTKGGSTFVVSSSVAKTMDDASLPQLPLSVEEKALKISQNIAAKKIQRSWRDHQTRHHQQNKDNQKNMEKALTFIVTSLKHHKLRKSKMNMLQKRKNSTPATSSNEAVTLEAIHATAQNMWEKAFKISS